MGDLEEPTNSLQQDSKLVFKAPTRAIISRVRSKSSLAIRVWDCLMARNCMHDFAVDVCALS